MTQAAEPVLSGAYRAVWRWHFYAGLLVLPFLMLLALTGGLYLFKAEIDRAAYGAMGRVEARAGMASPDRWAAAARVVSGGEIVNVLVPARPEEAVRITVRLPDESRRTVLVNPYDAQVTGITRYGGVTETIKRLHSLELFGPAMNILIEIVAGWAIILVATGLFLWWPRGRAVGTVSITTTDVARRPFWRDLHAVTGVFTGGIIVFLAVTGMPWSAVWGDRILNVMRESGLGRPAAPAAASPWSHAGHDDKPQGVGWTMENAVLPGQPQGAQSLERVMASADAAGLARPYLVSVPKTEGLAFTVAQQNTRVEDARSLYIDGASGAVKADIGYDRFGWGAKAFEWGIAVHQGQQYGQINRLIMLAGCIAIWVLSISGLVMWWKRRPRGRLGAPVAPPGPRVRTAVLAIVIPLCILYPLTGLSLLIALALDRAVTAIRARRPAAV
ncbi:PepSY domain-containing protein [Rhizobium sp. CRIBSB]|nr:PepSY domain-containing protein [Rhizobium sp. CRIBSB]